jgi:RiboL-PSP-HEPN
VAESLLQLYQLFHDLRRSELNEDLRLAVCAAWGDPNNALIQHARNDRVMVMARATATIPQSFATEWGLDFLLRQAVVVVCTSLEAFFWDSLRENVLTIVRARRTHSDESLRSLTLTLGDYISIQQYDDPDLRLKQVILKNFARGTLYNDDSIEKIARILTIDDFWNQVAHSCEERPGNLRRLINELIARRNQITHRADRPEEGEEADALGLRPISLAWTNLRVQAARTLVTASAELIGSALERLETQIRADEEQAEARRAAGENPV